jgi:hypothetical protein
MQMIPLSNEFFQLLKPVAEKTLLFTPPTTRITVKLDFLDGITR